MNIQDRFLYWITERESIRLKKESGKPKPWTTDKILQGYRFCNVRRMDDKVSRWLLKNWYLPYFNHPLIVPAVALARFVNLPGSLHEVGLEIFRSEFWNPDAYVNVLRDYRDEGNTVFNGAYMVRGNDGIDKIDCVINHYVCNVVGLELNTDSMEEAHAQIYDKYGFGSFMAGQVVADLRWAKKGRWKDRKTWAPVGPGSSRGLMRLLGESPKPNMKQERFDEEFARVRGLVAKNLPKIYKKLEAIDIQNCLCEADKYERVLHGEGKPKQLYKGA